MMATVRRSRRLGVALLLLAATACDDGTGPTGEFDARLAADGMASMVTATESLGDAFGSMQAAGTLFESQTAASLVADGPVLDARAVRRHLEAPRTEAFFPANFLGVTFAYDAGEEQYMATELTGAPADGIRILYYAVDPFTHAPQVASPLGHIDLRDLSTASSDRLGVTVVNTAGASPVELADYFIDIAWTLSETVVGAEMQSIGYLSDGVERLDFDLTQAVSLSETEVTFGQDFLMELAGSDLGVRHVVELSGVPGSEETGVLHLTATVTHQGQSVVFAVTATQSALEGTVTQNGALVATISGTPDHPEFTNAAGDAVDPAEIEALQELFEGLSALLAVAEGIFGPAG